MADNVGTANQAEIFGAEQKKLAEPFQPKSLDECLERMKCFHDAFAEHRDFWWNENAGYYRELAKEYQFLIPPGHRVLEIGCATGNLLASVNPSFGLGIDVSPRMIQRARRKFPDAHLQFEATAVEALQPNDSSFDYIILSDVLSFLYDIREVIEKLKDFCHARTRVVLNFYNHMWGPIFRLAESLGLKAKQPILNWISPEDVVGMLQLTGYEVILDYPRILVPKEIPCFSKFANRFLAPFMPFKWICFSRFVVARLPMPPFREPAIVSVVCPCRNEADNISEIVNRLPDMGARTELIFVEGHSQDNTYERCLEIQRNRPDRMIHVYRQTGKGKKDAVRLGYSKASGDVLMILDADMTVPPEDLPAFYNALMSGRVEFVNGSRLVYAMESKAMRFLNLCANKFFGWVFSFLINQPVKDTLCGTKVLTKSDYLKLATGHSYFGDFDPFGDFDLLFGASKLVLRIHDLPVRYRDRTYGETQISRFRHGFILLQMVLFGFFRLKCH
jgi:SAM-dependent methyltransferase